MGKSWMPLWDLVFSRLGCQVPCACCRISDLVRPCSQIEHLYASMHCLGTVLLCVCRAWNGESVIFPAMPCTRVGGP